MGNLLYIIAVILLIGWAIGLIGFHAGGFIHVLLVIAIIAVLFRIIQGRNLLLFTDKLRKGLKALQNGWARA